MQNTSYAKMSKKQRRIEDNKKRVTWGINPVTRKPDNPAAYNRNKEKAYLRKHMYANSVD